MCVYVCACCRQKTHHTPVACTNHVRAQVYPFTCDHTGKSQDISPQRRAHCERPPPTHTHTHLESICQSLASIDRRQRQPRFMSAQHSFGSSCADYEYALCPTLRKFSCMEPVCVIFDTPSNDRDNLGGFNKSRACYSLLQACAQPALLQTGGE